MPFSVIVRINVTEDDIRAGIKGSCVMCPIAIAISRVVGNEVYATWPSFYYYNPSLLRMVHAKQDSEVNKCLEFIGRFDSGRSVQPFQADLTFTTDHVEPYNSARFKLPTIESSEYQSNHGDIGRQ